MGQNQHELPLNLSNFLTRSENIVSAPVKQTTV